MEREVSAVVTSRLSCLTTLVKLLSDGEAEEELRELLPVVDSENAKIVSLFNFFLHFQSIIFKEYINT